MNNLTRVEKIVIIVTIIAVFMVFGGIGYAFFTMNDNTGSTAEITNTSGKMTINYADGGSNLLVSDNIVPSNTIIADKTFTLTGVNTTTGLTMPYSVGVKYENGFSSGMIHYYIKEVSSTNEGITANFVGTLNQTITGHDAETGYATGAFGNGGRYTEIVSGNFPVNTDNDTITFNLKLQFPDNGENQDSEKGKTFSGYLVTNYKTLTAQEYIADLYANQLKDENGITKDGLQKDGTGSVNIQNLSSNVDKKYNVKFLNSPDDNVLADIEIDSYDNIRFTGANPNNYVSFNNEIWRIIGLFSNVITVDENGNEQRERLIKIVRDNSLGNYSWDTSDESINSGKGINEWSQAKLMYELNCDGDESSEYCNAEVGITDGYLSDKTSGTANWYNNAKNVQTGTYNYSNNIKADYKDRIANVRWYIGGISSYTLTPINAYTEEHGNTFVSNPDDEVERKTSWDGKVGLVYASDYGFISTNEACRNTSLRSCNTNNWLFTSKRIFRMLSATSTDSYSVLSATTQVPTVFLEASSAYAVYPTIYLKSDTVIASGTGTSADPYVIK